MPTKIHTGRSTDTLRDISRRYFGLPNKTAEIINANQVLSTRIKTGAVDASGLPLIRNGDRLLIIIPSDTRQIAGVTQSDDSTLTMYLNGVERELPANDTTIELNFDSCCHRFASVFPWDYLNVDERRLWAPNNLPEIEIFQGSDVILGGKFESALPPDTPISSNLVTSARSWTYLLEKSVFPESAYPLTRENETLFQTCEWACGVFGLGVENLAPSTEKQKKVSCENSTTAWEFLSVAADNVSRVLRSSLDGRKLEIITPASGPPVSRFEEGLDGFQLSPPAFNTANIFGNHIGQRESAKSSRQMTNVRDSIFDEQSYSYHQIDKTDAARLTESTEYQAYKSYREFFTLVAVFPGIVNRKRGKRFKLGDVITINAPSRMIYNDFNVMIQKIRYVFSYSNEDASVKTELTLIPPEVYQGKPVAVIPWEIR